MIAREDAIELMKALDDVEAELRRMEHRLFALRDKIGKAFRLKVGHYDDFPTAQTDREITP